MNIFCQTNPIRAENIAELRGMLKIIKASACIPGSGSVWVWHNQKGVELVGAEQIENCKCII